MASWVNGIHRQGLILIDQIILAKQAQAEQGLELGELIENYQAKLMDLYADELALATLLDQSDLVFHAEGPSTREHAAVSGAVAWMCAEVERRLRQLGLAALGLTGDAADAAGADLKVLLNGLAPGSLYFGFSLGSEHMMSAPGKKDLLEDGETSALEIAKDVVRRLSIVPQFLGDQGIKSEIVDAFEDPMIRDAMLMTAFHLSPTGKRGIDAIEISSPRRSDRSSSSALTTRDRAVLRESAVRQPLMRSARRGTFVGEFREVDLDARRFQLRHVGGGVGSLRCVMSELGAETARRFIGRGVRVTGNYESGLDGKPRLLKVETVEAYQQQEKLI